MREKIASFDGPYTKLIQTNEELKLTITNLSNEIYQHELKNTRK